MFLPSILGITPPISTPAFGGFYELRWGHSFIQLSKPLDHVRGLGLGVDSNYEIAVFSFRLTDTELLTRLISLTRVLVTCPKLHCSREPGAAPCGPRPSPKIAVRFFAIASAQQEIKVLPSYCE